jgi:GNAT superfamily N-acetyltransferase
MKTPTATACWSSPAYMRTTPSSSTGDRTKNDPLPFLVPRRQGHYLLALREDNLIAGAVTLYHFEAHNTPYWKKEPATLFSQVSIHPDFRNRKIASTLLSRVFSEAAEAGKILLVSGSEPDGRRYLARAFLRLHRQHPTLKIAYSPDSHYVSGDETYTLGFDHASQTHVEYRQP